MTLQAWSHFLASNWFGRLFSSICIVDGNVIVTVRSFLDVVLLVEFLRRQTFSQFSQLLDCWAVDLYSLEERFQLNYLFLSLRFNFRLIIRCFLKDGGVMPSLTAIFHSASWLEREVWDLFGIIFSSHPDLRRILTDYGFVGFPLRKDFPLSGYLECRYSSELSKVILEPIELIQEFRFFQYLSPWSSLG
jgi:NADH-quinone oxidoreductase subunit C